MRKKIFVILIVFIFLFSSLSINSYGIKTNNGNINNSKIYGFITNIGPFENVRINKNKNCRTYNMINDLLRENISVYWTSEDINLLVSQFNVSIKINKFFEKGAFIIPFTGIEKIDKKITVIMCDYNQTSEIEDNITTIPIYKILEKNDIISYKLSNVKIIQITNKASSVEIWYFDNALCCGFLDIDLVEEKNLKEQLKNDYNVLIWPGAAMPIEVIVYTVLSGLKIDSTSGIVRDFVSNGGGFLGSCYGSFIASSGVLPFPMYLKRRAYNPDLNSIGIFSLADFLTMPIKYVGDVNVRIINNSHPVVYGIDDEIIVDHFEYGSKIVFNSKTVEVIAEFDKGNSKLEGSPDYVSSKFGEGRIVTFGSHPEFNPNIENKIVSNSLFYITSKNKDIFEINHERNSTFFLEILEKTGDLRKKMNVQENRLDYICHEINYTINCFSSYPENLYEYLIFYLKNDYYVLKTIDNLHKIESLSKLMDNDNKFNSDLEKIEDQIMALLNQAQISINKSSIYYKNFYKVYNFLGDFDENNTSIVSFIKKIIIRQFGKPFNNEFNILLLKCLYKCYFESTKFLRHYWYEYESSII